MTIRLTRAAAVAAALTLPAALQAQRPRPVDARASLPASSAEASARAMFVELQQIQGRLQAAHNRVMQDAGLRGQQEAFMRDVRAAMLRVDPGLEALAARVEGMRPQAEAAQRSGDRQTLQRLNGELVTIQQRFMHAQQEAMRQPALTQRAQQLENTLHARMVQVEPETDRLLARGRELQTRLVAMQQAMQQGRPQN